MILAYNQLTNKQTNNRNVPASSDCIRAHSIASTQRIGLHPNMQPDTNAWRRNAPNPRQCTTVHFFIRRCQWAHTRTMGEIRSSRNNYGSLIVDETANAADRMHRISVLIVVGCGGGNVVLCDNNVAYWLFIRSDRRLMDAPERWDAKCTIRLQDIPQLLPSKSVARHVCSAFSCDSVLRCVIEFNRMIPSESNKAHNNPVGSAFVAKCCNQNSV